MQHRMSWDPSRDKVRSNKKHSRSDAGPNVSAAARSGGHVTAPVLANNTITGNVHIIHNATGVAGHRTHSAKTQTSDISSVIHKYKELICSEYQYVSEYNSLPGEQVLLSERFTQPLIIQKHRDQKEREEEICASSRSSDQSVRLNCLFNPDIRGISPRAVILQGNSGNGKSFTVQKIMMDWASGDLYKRRFDIAFHLKCKEINRISGKKSLEEILSYSCSLTSDQISQVLQETPEKVLFIVDGFDELRLSQDVHPKSPHTDLHKRAPPEVTLCALLRGRILPESFLLVTTRSTATDTLTKLLKGPQGFTEIMGFSSKGVKKYFQRFFQNEDFFRKAYEYVKANETLITACSIPVICWIICTVMRERFSDGSGLTSGLETTTSIYVDFVSTLLEHHCQGLSQSVPALLRSLGQLAEKGMLEQQVLLDEKMVYETVADPAGSPFLSKFLFKRRIHQEMMFSFMHLSFQEFFTALYYISLDVKEFDEKFTKVCWNGQFAAVVNFLFGLINEEVRHTLKRKHGVFVHPNTQNILKEWLFQSSYSLEILHHLFELHEESFVKELLNEKRGISVQYTDLRRIDCWALLYCGQCCQSMKEVSLHGCDLTSEKLAMILPVLHKFEKLELTPESYSDLVVVIHALLRGRTLSSQSVEIEPPVFIRERSGYFERCTNYITSVNLSISEELSSVYIHTPRTSMREVTVTFPQSSIINFDWTNVFQEIKRSEQIYDWDGDMPIFSLQSLPGLKKMELAVYVLTQRRISQTISFSDNCPSLREIRMDCGNVPEDGLRLLQKSHTRPDCALTFEGRMYSTHHGTVHLKMYLNAGGFSMEELRPPLFPN